MGAKRIMTDSITRNRLANVHNRFQQTGKHKRVLCVCSAGLLRSPTIAYVLSQEPYNYNTRAAGVTPEFALIPVDDVLVEWAEEIVCANLDHFMEMTERYPDRTIINLNIPDEYDYRQPELIELINKRYMEIP
jgi:predicted protein tyrosine phosphatase